jgi:hypothetical protein
VEPDHELARQYAGQPGHRAAAAQLQVVAYFQVLALRSSVQQQAQPALPPHSASLTAASSSGGVSGGGGGGGGGAAGPAPPAIGRRLRLVMEALAADALLEMVPQRAWPQGCATLGKLWLQEYKPLFATELPEVSTRPPGPPCLPVLPPPAPGSPHRWPASTWLYLALPRTHAPPP